jgi:hypothetical protein
MLILTGELGVGRYKMTGRYPVRDFSYHCTFSGTPAIDRYFVSD